MSQFGTISRQISRHNSSTTSSASMVSATGTYRRAPSVSSQQPHINGGPAYTQNSGLIHLFISKVCVSKVVLSNLMKLAFWLLLDMYKAVWKPQLYQYTVNWFSIIMLKCYKGSKRYELAPFRGQWKWMMSHNYWSRPVSALLCSASWEKASGSASRKKKTHIAAS